MSLYDIDLPSADEIDIPALKAKYQQERDRRIRKEGQAQYIKSVEDFAYSYEGDPYTPVTPRAPIARSHEVVILGGGWSGIMAGVALRNAGIKDFCNIDHAGDFGGV